MLKNWFLTLYKTKLTEYKKKINTKQEKNVAKMKFFEFLNHPDLKKYFGHELKKFLKSFNRNVQIYR